MEIAIETDSPSPLVTLTGRFDSFETAQFREKMDQFADQSHEIRVHLGAVNFIDSSGLAELVRSMKRSREAGGDVVLCAPSQTVRVILELTRLDMAFTIRPDA